MPLARRRKFGGFARPEGGGVNDQPVTPAFITTPDQLPVGIAHKSYFHQFSWIGNPEPIFEVVGYEGPFRYSQQGALFIPDLAPGSSRQMYAHLRENLGDVAGEIVATITWTLVVSEPPQLTDAVINSTSLSAVLFGASSPDVPLDVSGSEPYTLSNEDGSPPSGLSLRQGALTKSELAVSFVDGLADQEGAGTSWTIGVTGATGVKATKVFPDGIAVNRPPTFVGLQALPKFPVNTPGSFSLATFIRAHPPITGFTTNPVLSTVHPNIGKSGLTITHGDLTTLAGTQTEPILFTLDSNGIGDPDTLTSVIDVDPGSIPVPGVVAAYDFSSYSATNGAEITSVPDLAQGAALPMSTALTIAGTVGPSWDATNECAQMRAGKSIGIAVDVGLYPFAVGLNAKPKSTSPTGTREFLRGTNTFMYFDKGVAGGARPTFLSSVPFTKTGTRSSDQCAYSPASEIRALVVKLGHSDTAADIIASVTVSNGGPQVPLNRAPNAAVDATGEFARTYIYFLGSGIPTGALTITINYSSGVTAKVFVVVEGYTAANDVEIVHAPTAVQGDGANPSIVCDTGSPARDCIATAILGSGQGTLASITDGGSQTRQHAFAVDLVGGSVAFDAATRNNRSGTSDPTTFTHTPVGTPQGVFFIAQGQTVTDHYVGFTYGGVTVPSVDTRAGSTRFLRVGFLGTGVPSGPQTASFDWDSATTDDIELYVVTVTSTGGGDIEVVDIDGFANTGANSSVTMNAGGKNCTAFGFGQVNVAEAVDISENPNMTVLQEIDKGSSILCAYRQTNPSTSDFTWSLTHASAVRTLSVISVAEIAAPAMQFVASRQTTGGTGDFTFSWTIASEDTALCAITMSEVQGSGGAVLSVASNVLGSTDAQSGVIDTQARHILYAASPTTGSYWKNGVKSALTPAGAGNIAQNLKNIILHGQQCDWDLYKLEIWRGALSDGDATAMDARLNSDRTPPVPNPPNPPTNIVATGGNTVVNLSWTPAPNAISVKIERSATGGGAGFSQIVAGVVNATYQDTGRTNGTQYFYRFKSTGLGGDSPTYSAEFSATPQVTTVGVPANNRVTNVGSQTITQEWDAVPGATYKVYRGTAQGGPYTLIQSAVTALSFEHTGLTNGQPYSMVVKASIGSTDSGNSNEVTATPQSSTGITRTFPLIDGVLTADLLLSQHASDLIFEASGPGIQGRLVNSPTSGGGSNTAGHLIGGFPFMKPVTKTVPHLGGTRKFFEMTIWDSSANSFLYPSNGSIRATIAAGKYDTNVGLQEEWFYAMAFMVDDSMIQVDPILSGFDHGFLGLHNAIVSGLTLTPMSFFLDPTSAGTMQLRITIRFHPEDNAQPGETRRVEAGASIGNIRPGHYYELLYRWKLGYWNVHGGYAQAWLYEDGVARNAGKPFLDHAGRLGYNLPTPPGFKHQRRIMSHYQWRGKNQFTQVSPDNIGGIPSGAKGSRMWVRKSLCCAGGTSGGITVTKDTLLNYLRLVE